MSFADDVQGESQQQQQQLIDVGGAALSSGQASPHKPAASVRMQEAHQPPMLFSPQDGDAFGSSIGLSSAPTQGVGEVVSQPPKKCQKRGQGRVGSVEHGFMAETQIAGDMGGEFHLTGDVDDQNHGVDDMEMGEEDQCALDGQLHRVESNDVVPGPPRGVHVGGQGGAEVPVSDSVQDPLLIGVHKAGQPEEGALRSTVEGDTAQPQFEEEEAADDGGLSDMDGDENSRDGLAVRSQGSQGKPQLTHQPSEGSLPDRGALYNLSNLQHPSVASGCFSESEAPGAGDGQVGSYEEQLHNIPLMLAGFGSEPVA